MSFNPIQIGLTGSIGMGKSTLTKQFKALGIPVFDADEAVHQLYSNQGEAIEPLRQHFPKAIVNNQVDRKQLMEYILQDASNIKIIEGIVHPLVISKRMDFYSQAKSRGELMVVYDIPLLFETYESHKHIEHIIVASAKPEIQRQRVLDRPGMTIEKFESILSKQKSDEYKRTHADYVIQTDFPGYSEGKAQLAKAIEGILSKEQSRFELWKTKPSLSSDNSRAFDAVIFDLDDTIAGLSGPMTNAIRELNHFLQVNMPQTHQKLQTIKIGEVMKQIALNNPFLLHDYTELRYQALTQISQEFQEEQTFIPQAMETFLKYRSDVNEYLYSDTIPCFDYLKQQGIQLGIFTNGNSQLRTNALFTKYCSVLLSSQDVGALKPSLVGFLTCCQQLQLPPHRILFVGDSYDKDMMGAKAIGMKTCLIYRSEVLSTSEKLQTDKQRLYSLYQHKQRQSNQPISASELSKEHPMVEEEDLTNGIITTSSAPSTPLHSYDLNNVDHCISTFSEQNLHHLLYQYDQQLFE